MAEGIATVRQVVCGTELKLVSTPGKAPPRTFTFELSDVQCGPVTVEDARCPQDQCGGFAARELLRLRGVGKVVRYVALEESKGVLRGDIFFREENSDTGDYVQSLTKLLLRLGLARIKDSADQELVKLEQEARNGGLGIWGSNESEPLNRILQEDSEATKALEKKCLNVMVESCESGTRFVGCLALDAEASGSCVRHLAMRIELAGLVVEPLRSSRGGGAPLAEAAKLFVEMRMLQRNCDLTAHHIRADGVVIGSLVHRNGQDIGVCLLRSGLAQLREETLVFATDASMLRLANADAKKNQAGLFCPDNFGSPVANPWMIATVVDVPTADTLVVCPTEGLSPIDDKRFFVASVRAPRANLSPAMGLPTLVAIEAAEYVRRRTQGRQIRYKLIYTRTLDEQKTGPHNILNFCQIFLPNGPDLAEQLVKRGFASVLPTRSTDPTPDNHDVLLAAEQTALQQRCGLHGPLADKTIDRVQNLTHGSGNVGANLGSRAKFYLDKLRNLRNFESTVETVLCGHKLILHSRKENIKFPLLLEGVRTPPARYARNSGPQVERELLKSDPGTLALSFVRKNCIGRDVAVKINAVDRGGNFLGSLAYHPTDGKSQSRNLALDLVELGLARLFGENASNVVELRVAESKAQGVGVGLWASTEAEEVSSNLLMPQTGKQLVGHITHVTTVEELFFQLEDAVTAELEESLQSLSADPSSLAWISQGGPIPRMGEVVLAPYGKGNTLYRARVDFWDKEASGGSVTFVDFGNRERKRLSELSRLPRNLSLEEVPARAVLCALAGCNEIADYEYEAAQAIQNLVEGKRLLCTILDYSDKQGNTKAQVLVELCKDENASDEQGLKNATISCRYPKGTTNVNAFLEVSSSLNSVIVRKGLALANSKTQTLVGSALAQAQEKARAGRVGAWRYGDFVDT